MYYFENGLRKVQPYHYVRQIFCKERWLNRTVDNVFEQEIRELVLDERRVCLNNFIQNPAFSIQANLTLETRV